MPRDLRELRKINREVNADVRYREDLDLYDREDFWTLPEVGADGRAAGDCEDIALEKRRQLLALGWPLKMLRLAVCRDRMGAGHCVLTVDYQGTTLVLDNNEDRVMGWRDTGYRWVMRQRAGQPGWVKIVGIRTGGEGS